MLLRACPERYEAGAQAPNQGAEVSCAEACLCDLLLESLVHRAGFHIGKATYSCCLFGSDEGDGEISHTPALPRQQRLHD
jgi:hypothetical protein